MEHKLTKGEIAIHKIKGKHEWTKPTTGVVNGYPYLESHCKVCGKKATEEDINEMGKQNPYPWDRPIMGSGIHFTTSSGISYSGSLNNTTYS